MDFWRKTE